MNGATFIIVNFSAFRRDPSIAQLVERWTVDVADIHRSLVRIRLEGYQFFFFSSFPHRIDYHIDKYQQRRLVFQRGDGKKCLLLYEHAL